MRFAESKKAPSYQLLPTRGRAHRVFIAGTVTEVDDVGDGSEYWRARVVDPNGDGFFVFAGQYQPDATPMLRELEPPEYVSVVGKTDTYEGNDGETYVSVQAEEVTKIDETTRDRWVIEAAEQTLDRLDAALDGEQPPGVGDEVDENLFGLALERYGRQAVEEAREATAEAVATLTEEMTEREGTDAPTAAAD